MTLSVCIVTLNSAKYIERLLRTMRSLADEIVVAVDCTSTDATEEICSLYADKLFRIESVGMVERALAWLNEQCSGDWILRLDDDELLASKFVQMLPTLMADKEVTHYWLRRFWLIELDGSLRVLDRPDWQLRFFRNITSIVKVPSLLHTSYHIRGACRYLSTGFYHLDLVYHSKQERMKKVDRYERISPGNTQAVQYFPPETSLSTSAIADDDPMWEGDGPLPYPLKESRAQPEFASLAEIQRWSYTDRDLGIEVFKATLSCSGFPSVVACHARLFMEVELRNDSPVSWPFHSIGSPRVRVSYHWLAATRQIYNYDGERTDLPHTLHSGQTTRLLALVIPPGDPGDYILQWDLLIEGVSWFSKHGGTYPEFPVRVVGA